MSYERIAYTDIATLGASTTTSVGGGVVLTGTTMQVGPSDFTTTSGTLVDITGLSFAAVASKLYALDLVLKCNSDNVSGVAVGINFSAALATLTWAGVASAGSTTTSTVGTTTLNAHGGSFAAVANVPGVLGAKGFITTGVNPGNITIKILKQSSGTATVYAGSYLTVYLLT
jgi:hypothetical protein